MADPKPEAPGLNELASTLGLEMSPQVEQYLWAGIEVLALGAGGLFVLLLWRKMASSMSEQGVLLRLVLHLVMGGLAGYLTVRGLRLTDTGIVGVPLLAPVSGSVVLHPGASSLIACTAAALLWPVLRALGLTYIAPRDRVEKGAELVTPEKLAKLVMRDGPARIRLGGVPVPKKAEPVHFLMLGGTGSGKSVAINQLLSAAYDDNDTIIIVDSGGDFASRYYDPKRDVILNPFDARSVAWNPLAEMDSPYDAEALSKSIIPNGVGESKEWNGYAQTFLAACLTVLRQENKLDIADLIYLVQQAPVEELHLRLAGTAAVSQLSSEKTFGSIRVIATNYLSAYSYLPSAASGAKPFSVKQFVSRGKGGALFVTYRDDQLDSLQNLIACVLDVASRAVLSLTPNPTRRVWLIVDEFASIGRVQSIESFAAKARKCGGCLVVGIQSVSQLFDPNRYGEHGGQTLLANLGTWLVLRCSDADTAEYMSRYLGEQRIRRQSRSQSRKSMGAVDSESTGEQVDVQRIVMGAELQELAPLHGYLRVAGGHPVAPVTLAIKKGRKATGAAYVPREFSATPRASAPATPALEAAAPGLREPAPTGAPAWRAPLPPVAAAPSVAPRMDAPAAQWRPPIPGMPAPMRPVAPPPADPMPTAPRPVSGVESSAQAGDDTPALMRPGAGLDALIAELEKSTDDTDAVLLKLLTS